MTDKEIVDGCNVLARKFYGLHGYVVSEGYDFANATHPQEQIMWAMAMEAYDQLHRTDVRDAIFNLE